MHAVTLGLRVRSGSMAQVTGCTHLNRSVNAKGNRNEIGEPSVVV